MSRLFQNNIHSTLLYNTLLSSFLGSLSGVVGKYASQHDNIYNIVIYYYSSYNTILLQLVATLSYVTNNNIHNIVYIIQALLYIVMLLLNSIMLSITVRTMNQFGTYTTTTLNTGIGFVCNGLIGYILFNEYISYQWLYGMCCILIGVISIQYGTYASQINNNKNTIKTE